MAIGLKSIDTFYTRSASIPMRILQNCCFCSEKTPLPLLLCDRFCVMCDLLSEQRRAHATLPAVSEPGRSQRPRLFHNALRRCVRKSQTDSSIICYGLTFQDNLYIFLLLVDDTLKVHHQQNDNCDQKQDRS